MANLRWDISAWDSSTDLWGGTETATVSPTNLSWDTGVWNNDLWGSAALPAEFRVIKVETIRAIDEPVMYIVHLRGGA